MKPADSQSLEKLAEKLEEELYRLYSKVKLLYFIFILRCSKYTVSMLLLLCASFLVFYKKKYISYEQADYHVMLKEQIEPRLQVAIRSLSSQGHQRQQMSHQTPSSSTYITMFPTPGMA